MGAEGYGVSHQSQHPSLAGLASPGPRLPQSSSCCLQSSFAHKYEFIRRRQPAPRPQFPAECSWLVPGQLKHWSSKTEPPLVMPQLKSLTDFSCPLCPTWALEATHQIAPSSSHRLSQASFMLLHKPYPPFRRQALSGSHGDLPPPCSLPCPSRENLLSTEFPEPWPPCLFGQRPCSSVVASVGLLCSTVSAFEIWVVFTFPGWGGSVRKI